MSEDTKQAMIVAVCFIVMVLVVGTCDYAKYKLRLKHNAPSESILK